MIIRNGFVRDVDGRWTNLNLLSSFSVCRKWFGQKEAFYVRGYTLEGNYEWVMSNLFDTEDEAQGAIDDALGCNG